jgi:hypothetical protein
MTLWLQWLTFAVSLALQVLVIWSLRRGAYRDYPFVLAYCAVSILTTVADALVISEILKLSPAALRVNYYRNAALRQVLLFTVVVSLIDRAMKSKPYRERVRVLLTVAAGLAVGLSLYIHSGAYKFSLWMTQVTRDLSFGSVALTLLLWSTLIASKKKDDQLLMITGGLGLQFTGEAIGQSLRQLSQHRPTILLLANILLSVSHLMRLYVWREAFRGKAAIPPIKREPGGNGEAYSRQAQTISESNG